ncbi:aldehyde ferredoxin oxidoreductase N-terminal domain-containing protein [Chloroflexota bacterium]
MDYYGYAGKILYVDLTSGDIDKRQLDTEVAQKYLGGWGINYRLEYDLLQPDTDPLSADNPIIIGVGTLCGTLAPASSKCTMTTKLPVCASKSEKKHVVATAVGGNRRFGAMVKNAGFDHVVITGRARKPSYLKIIDDDVAICEASDLWGRKDTYETSDELADRHRGRTGKAGTWVIGKAGENLLTTSIALVDGMGSMGRWGGAAVLGSKNLKAVVALGTKGIRIAEPKRFMALVDRKRQEIMSHPAFGSGYPVAARTGGSPLLQSPYPPELDALTRYASIACMSCVDCCKISHEIKEGRFAGITEHGIHLFFMGESDKARRLKLPHYGDPMMLADLLNRAGICLMSGLRMLHFVTSLYERGVISEKDTGGLALRTGDIDAYIRLLEKWLNREDIGEYMAQGWYALGQRFGVDAGTDFEDGTPIVRGGEVLHDVRWRKYDPTFMLSQTVRPKPQHVQQGASFPAGEDIQQDTYWPGYRRSLNDIKRDLVEKTGASREDAERIFTDKDFNFGRLEKHSEDALGVYNSLGICTSGPSWDWHPMRDIPLLSELYSAATGFKVTPEELKTRGERVWNMEALLNVREGIMGEDYDPPVLWLQHTEKPVPVDAGDYYAMDWLGRRVSKDDIYRWLDDYYYERGWDKQKRIPTREKLRALGLEEFIPVVEPYLE